MRQSTLHRIGWPVPVAVPWRALLAAALLSAVLAAVISQGLSPHAAAPIAGATRQAGLARLPLAAQGQVSAALGADTPSYHLARSHGGVEGLNRAQRLATRFARAGVQVSSAGTTLGLSLRGIGYGRSLTPVAPVTPTFAANRVLYAHPQVSEWYVNGPLGLEQGFTLAHAPAGDSAGPLTLSLAIAGDTRASLAGGGRSVTFTGPSGSSLHYGDLVATDARGRTLHSWLALTHGHILLRVATRGARYPIRVDPIFDTEPEQKLTATDEEGEGRLGYSVALSADGSTAVIGGPRDTGRFGAAWVFVRSGSSWVQQGPKLQESAAVEEATGEHCGEAEEEGDACSFGRSVALSADGNTALVGSPRDSGLVPMAGGEETKLLANVGAAWVFTREGGKGGKWTEQGKLTGGQEGGEGRFGKSVALSADGKTALVGGSSDHSGHGAAWVFTLQGATWAQQGSKLTGGEEQGEPHFGGTVALSGDGQTALIGGPGDREYIGAAWVFTREGSTWAQQSHKLGAGDEQGAGHFGFSVALSFDGNTALIGARADNENQGAAWVFTRSGSSWTQQGSKLLASEPGEQQLGYSVALSADGNSALLGGPRVDGARGAAWLFERSGSSWGATPQRLASPGEAGKGWFGYGVALSADAKVALVGAPNEAVGKVVGIGSVWAYSADPRPLITQVRPTKGPAAGGTEVRITGTNFEEVSSVRFGATSARFTVENSNSIVAFSPSGTGVVDITVTNAPGTSTTQEADRFTYIGSEPASGGTVELTAAAGGTTGAGGGVLAFSAQGGACRVSLVKRSILVKSHSRAVLKLTSKGPGTCRGKLKLFVKVKAAKGRAKTKTIATGSFSIAAGKARTITLKLNATGRALLSAGHGRLSARLSILRVSPAPRVTLTSAVRLASQKRKTTSGKSTPAGK
jgi:hypothetical protein